ncbi:MAG: hypothetical protein WCB58_15135 [Acidobacteriaceae bacterium]
MNVPRDAMAVDTLSSDRARSSRRPLRRSTNALLTPDRDPDTVIETVTIPVVLPAHLRNLTRVGAETSALPPSVPLQATVTDAFSLTDVAPNSFFFDAL